ncbi:hypothetical protein [Microbacterium marinilacus]|uniref:Uncharacterized protein n=1 Tax=Microbacterium marinilacus TaxID=415209 RepID=A0ABP7BHX2_9MICO|nr:hypothetical protein [Microbacterium marinilacus]MBY0689577.1 hypothetical protein [Microbacterium marinilacus]
MLATLILAGCGLSGCTAQPDAAETPAPAATSSAPETEERPVAAATLPEGSEPVLTWTDQVGAVPPETVRLTGSSLSITVLVACDTADATVTIDIDGLMAGGSTCFHSPDIVGSHTGGNTATMEVTVDQDATVTVTAEPSDARWSAVVSTGTD